MITNDYIKGYVAALDNINEFCNALTKDKYDTFMNTDLRSVQNYIKEVRENYKKLVKELNETQSKKTST